MAEEEKEGETPPKKELWKIDVKIVAAAVLASVGAIAGVGMWVAHTEDKEQQLEKDLAAEHAAAIVEHDERVAAQKEEHAELMKLRDEEHKDKAELLEKIGELHTRVSLLEQHHLPVCKEK